MVLLKVKKRDLVHKKGNGCMIKINVITTVLRPLAL